MKTIDFKFDNYIKMKNKIFLILFIIFFVTLSLNGQLFRNYTQLDKTKESVDGFSLGLGAGMTDFLNKTFYNSIENSNYKQNIGFILEGNYSWHPLIFNLSLFGSNFNTSQTNYIKNGTEVNIKHTGAEGSISLGLFHFTKYFIPHIGVGYQKAVLGSGITWLGLKNEEETDIYFIKKLDVPVFKAGVNIYFSRIGFSIDYKTSFDSKVPFNQYSICLLIKYN